MIREIKFRAWHKNSNHMCRNIKTDLLDRDYLVFMQYTELNDINGDNIYEGDIVYQKSVIVDSENINFTGEVKFYNGSWWLDNGINATYLFNKYCENKIVGNKFEGIRD
ncbi:YopX family protein [Clostridium sp. UBA871]|uniref:YopX family protein n=1 Tax=Clostridium sp. UBA871 TaxID=1946380 RepID=UPI0032169679